MNYAEILRRSSNTWAAAYVRFTTSLGRSEYTGFLFGEDEDDLIFYQHVLSDTEGLCYVGCGGKSGVLAVYRKLVQDRTADGSLFIVDRDTDVEPFEGNESVLRTAGYSWESHVCDPEYVRWIAQRRLNPSLTDQNAKAFRDNWCATVEAFREPLSSLTALLRTALVLDQSLGLSQASFLEGARFADGILRPGDNALDWQPVAVARAIVAGATAEDIVRREEKFRGANLYKTAKGKVLVALLRTFIRQTMQELDCTFRGEYNSAKHLAAAMPWNFPATDYIREYALGRLNTA